MKIPNKTIMYQKLRAGDFGNTVRSWTSYAALAASDYRGDVGIRSTAVAGKFQAHVPFADVQPESSVIYSEMQDDACILLQGEVYRSYEGLYLYASTVKTHMRPALREGGKHYWLLAARAQMEAVMWPADYECIQELLAEYDESVIEFSVYNKAAGLLPNRNTIIWEVRNY